MVTFLIVFGAMILLYIVLAITMKLKEKKFYSNWNRQFDPRYNKITDDPFQTTLSGVKHSGCEQAIVKNRSKLKTGTEVCLVPDPDNKYDNTATKVCMKTGQMLGWLPNKEWNDRIFTDLINGKKWEATIEEVLSPGSEFNNYNLLINIYEITE